MNASVSWSRPPNYDVTDIRLVVSGIDLAALRDDPEALVGQMLSSIREVLEPAVSNRGIR